MDEIISALKNSSHCGASAANPFYRQLSLLYFVYSGMMLTDFTAKRCIFCPLFLTEIIDCILHIGVKLKVAAAFSNGENWLYCFVAIAAVRLNRDRHYEIMCFKYAMSLI